MMEEDSYNALQIGNPPQPELELLAMRKQEHKYLDGILNLEHCIEIDITKNRKKDDKTMGAHTAVSGPPMSAPKRKQALAQAHGQHPCTWT